MRGLMVSPGDAVRGTLPEGALAPLIGRLHRARASGWLRLTGMEVRGGIPSVIRVGFLLLEARVSAVEAADDPLRPPGADAAERGTAAIARVLGCRDVVQAWEPAGEAGPADPASPFLAALGLRALERLAGGAVRAALGETGRRLSTCPPGEAALAALTSAQRILMTRVRSDATAAEILAAGDEEDMARGLLALLCAGAADWVEEAARPAPPRLPPPLPPLPASAEERPRTGESQAYRAVSREAGPPPAAAAATPPVADPAVLRRDVDQAHAALRGASHFTVLGVGPAATTDEVRRAFTVLARRYHPDAQRDPALEDLRPKLTELFVAVSDAYAVLKDPVARDRYERALAARVAAESAAATRRTARPWAGPGADDSVEARILRAEEALVAGEPWETVRILEEAIPAAVGPSKARAQVLLARGYVERERPRDAEKVLLDALQGDPRALEACLLLARLYRDRGMVKRAQGMYERALEIDPRQPEARRELAGLGMEPPDPGRSGGSFLSRFRDRR